jgi:hypothetical protein
VTRRFVDALIIAVAGAIAVSQSWMRWLDPIVDTGRDLYIPEQIANGAKLYRDIVYFYPPLTPYALAAIVKVAGSSIAVYVAIGLSIAAATAALIYFVTLRVSNRVAATAAAATFAACSIAGQSTWGSNYIFPYAHAATIAMLLFLGFLAAIVLRNEPLAVALAVAASWTKIEYALFTAVVLIVAIAVRHVRARAFAELVALHAVAFGFVSFVFRDADWLHGNVIPDAMRHSAALRTFYASVAGFDQWPLLVAQSAVGAACVVAIVLLLRRDLVAVAAIAGIALGAAGYFFGAWSLLQIALIPMAIRRGNATLAVLLAASLCASSRVFLHLAPIWYGFVLIVPVYILAAYVVFEWLPAAGVYSRRAACAWICVFAAVALRSLVIAHGAYATKTYPIVTPRGTIYDRNADRAAVLNAFGKSGIGSVVVLPEGLALNYLFKIPTPIAYYTFTPPETADPKAEERILREFESKKPEWIALVPRDMSEFGSRGFGIDYDTRLAAYIRSNYKVAATYARPNFSLVVMQRN